MTADTKLHDNFSSLIKTYFYSDNMFVSDEKKDDILGYQTEIERYFSVSLEFFTLEGELDGSWLVITGDKSVEATEFAEILTGDFPVEKMEFSLSIQRILQNALEGYFAKMIQFQYKVLLTGLDDESPLLTIQGKDDNRMNCICFLSLQDTTLCLKDVDSESRKLLEMMRNILESEEMIGQVENLQISSQIHLWRLVSKEGYPGVDKCILRLANQRKLDEFNSLLSKELDWQGLKIYEKIQVEFPKWDMEKAQMIIFERIEHYKLTGTKMNEIDVIKK